MTDTPSRRTFLLASAAGAVALLPTPSLAAHEKLNVGVIGCGARGLVLAREVVKRGHRLTALCDVAEFRFGTLSEVATDDGQDKPAEYTDARRLLDQKGLDAVVIATPNHLHRDQFMAAIQAEKDVYVESPLAWTIAEGRDMKLAAEKGERVVQVGLQRRSGGHWKRLREVIDGSDFGALVWAKVVVARPWGKKDPFAPPPTFGKKQRAEINWDAFLGKAGKREFDADRYWGWRWYWDYAGGPLTEFGGEYMDLLHWLFDVDSPKSVSVNGGQYYFKTWDTPDTAQATFDYGKFGVGLSVELINGADGLGITLCGTQMTAVIDLEGQIRLYDTTEKIAADAVPTHSWEVAAETPAHVKNWLDCCKSRKPTAAPIDVGHKAAIPAHLANLSYRSGKRIHWDAERQEVIGG